MLGIGDKYPIIHPKNNLQKKPQKTNCRNLSVKYSTEKPILLNFLNWSTIFPRLQQIKEAYIYSIDSSFSAFHLISMNAKKELCNSLS